MKRLTALIGLSICLSACVTNPRESATPLRTKQDPHQRIHDVAKRLGFDPDAYAFMAQSAPEPAGIFLSHRADAPMQPASTIKLLTSAVALDRLGPEHRGFTELQSAASIQDERLHGDLWLIAGADPEFGLSTMWEMLLQLRAKSIRVIDGNLLVNRHRFRPARFDQDLPAFDEAPEFAYNLIPDALSAHGALQDIELRSDQLTVEAKLIPELPGIVIENGLILRDTPCANWSGSGWQTPQQILRVDGTLAIVLRGSFPKQCRQLARLQLVERNRLLEAQFRWLWSQLGGSWNGGLREVTAHEAAQQGQIAQTSLTVMLRRQSRPWGEWLRPLNKRSDNALTRLLYLEIGAMAELAQRAADPSQSLLGQQDLGTATGQALSTFMLAEREVLAWMQQRGINTEGLVLENGSGLSRAERMTAAQMVSMLSSVSREHRYHDLMMSLPVAGEDGTLKRRYTGHLATGSARLKTGSLWNVSAIAGVVLDRRKRPWMVSIMVNHPRASTAAPLITEIIDTVASIDDDHK